MAANCLPFLFVCSKKYAKCESVSVVSPDLEATMKSVVASLIFERTPRIVAGSVVSRTCSFGCPLRVPNVLRSTSGHRLDPPMPSRTTSESLRPCTARSLSSPPFSSILSATSSQPSRSRISCLLAGSALQRVESLAHRRRGASSFCSLASCASTAGWSGPRLYHWRGPFPALISFALFSRAATRLSNDFVNASTPSTSSSAVTWSRSTPTSASCFSWRRARSTFSSRLRRTSPCSRNAASVAGGIVSTVSGPISSST